MTRLMRVEPDPGSTSLQFALLAVAIAALLVTVAFALFALRDGDAGTCEGGTSTATSCPSG